MRSMVLLSCLSIAALAIDRSNDTAPVNRYSRIDVVPADGTQGKPSGGGGGARPPSEAPRPQQARPPSSPSFNAAPRLQQPPLAPRPNTSPSIPRVPSNQSPPRPPNNAPQPRPSGPGPAIPRPPFERPPPRPEFPREGPPRSGPPPPRPDVPRGGIGNGPPPPRPPNDRPRGYEPRPGSRPPIPVGERPPNWTRPPPPPNGVRPGAYPPPPPPGPPRERDWERDCRRGLCGAPSNRGRDWGPIDCRRGGCDGWTNYRGDVFRGGYWRDNRGYIWREDAWYDLVGRRYPGPSPIIVIEPVPVVVPSIPDPFRPRPPTQSIEDYCDSLDVDTRDLPDVCLDACEQTKGDYDFCWIR